MNVRGTVSALLIAFFSIGFHLSGNACSMYKVTVGHKTMVGSNEDAWRTTSRIWFENAMNEQKYGAGFTGSRKVGIDKYAPQSGMNEVGLVFARLAAYHPKRNLKPEGKKAIKDEVQYLTNILHNCKTIDDVKRYIELYDHSGFLDDVFIYVDQSGDYLIVEPYTSIEGKDPSYILANFCPSLTSNQIARRQERFKRGQDYLRAHGLDTSLNFCIAMSDTMHVCRNRNGDGTLLTSIWDSQKGLVNLYFYHSYDSTVQFSLSEELAKGDHMISVPGLFPENPEFERLVKYKTPFNVPSLRFSLVFLGGFLFLLSFVYLISYFRKRNTDRSDKIKLVYSALNFLMVAYLCVLATNINIYYFDAPYRHYSSDLISLSSYIPFLLLLFILPATFYVIRYIKFNGAGRWIKGFLVLNSFVYVMLVMGFGYWGLFTI